MSRSHGDSDAPSNLRGKHLAVQLTGDLLRQLQNLPGESQAGVKLIEENAQNLQARIKGFTDRFYGVLNLRNSNQAENLCLHGNDEAC